MGKGCPSCHQNSWKICPKCGEYTCRGCGKIRGGEKQKSSNTCMYCKKTSSGWKTTNTAPSWATY